MLDDCCSEDEVRENLFMVQEVLVPEEGEEEEKEGEVDIEAKLISALEELKKTRIDLKNVEKVKKVATEE